MNPIGRLLPADLAAFLTAHPSTILLDVRELWEHEHASIAGSILIPLGGIALRAGDELPDRDAPIVVYCHHGVRSMQACTILAGLGYSSLFNLTGGIDRYGTDVDRSIPAY